MEENNTALVPLYAVEKQMHRLYQIIRLLVLVIVVIFLAFAGYVFYEAQFETVTIEQEATSDDNSRTILNGQGGLTINGD